MMKRKLNEEISIRINPKIKKHVGFIYHYHWYIK